ncbi:MAG: signal peptidase II [Thermaerobacter sp.]|nr:signal peptidase II [Thermaerobacter sp.]
MAKLLAVGGPAFGASLLLTLLAVKGIGLHVLVVNRGVGFGMLASAPVLAAAVDFGGLLVVVWLTMRGPVRREAAVLVAAGGLANGFDRLFFPGVIDYWRVPPYPYVFNLADVLIRLGVVWIVVDAVWRRRRAGVIPPAGPAR